MRNSGIEVDNQLAVVYSPLLSKAYKTYINMEYYNSVKWIKHIYKYVNKGSDMAVLSLQPETSDRNAVIHIDEVAQYEAGRHISSNEAEWQIRSLPTNERSPVVIHLEVHLRNGQRVYLKAEKCSKNSPESTGYNVNRFLHVMSENDVMQKHCCIRKCIRITHEMRVERHLKDANEERGPADNLECQRNRKKLYCTVRRAP